MRDMSCGVSMEGVQQESFGAVKARMDTTLATLRNDLIAMQQQDLALLRQLMAIQQTIHMLANSDCGHYLQRSYSVSTPDVVPAEAASPPLPVRHHMPLYRVHSEPLQRQPTEESTEDEGPDTDDLGWSYNSSAADLGSNGALDEDLEKELLDQLAPLPAAFTRKRLHMATQTQAKNTLHLKQPYRTDEISERGNHCTREPSTELKQNHHPKLQRAKRVDDKEAGLTDANGENAQERPKSSENRPSSPHSPSSFAVGTKMAPEHSPHYRNILKRSSQIWREIKQEQEVVGHVDARKMAALELFL